MFTFNHRARSHSQRVQMFLWALRVSVLFSHAFATRADIAVGAQYESAAFSLSLRSAGKSHP